jgi:mitochondrial fission protein ELM1
MKPSLPAALFELCLVPEHDLAGKQAPPDHVIPTRGALNRVPPPADDHAAREDGLILLGGPSSAYGWDGAAITAAVKDIVARGKRPWHITDSRRTPPGTLEAIAAEVPGLIPHPHAETGRDWLPQRLARAAEVWVTEESISMIYEALSSGAHVGLLPVPALRKAGRVARGIARLAAEGYVTRFTDWAPRYPLAAPPQVLREADRCAGIVVERFFGRR